MQCYHFVVLGRLSVNQSFHHSSAIQNHALVTWSSFLQISSNSFSRLSALFLSQPSSNLTTQSWHRLHRLKAKSSTWLSSLQMLDMSLGRSLDHILFCPTSYKFGGSMTFPLAQWVKNPIAMQETQGMRLWSLGEEMATHYSILA